MTMPHERLRSLGWGRDTLADIAADVLVPEPLRRQATWLYSIYPDTGQILQLVRSGAPALPDQWVSVFTNSLKLFTALHHSSARSTKTRTALLYTLRHYPDGGLLQTMGRLDSLVGWLEDGA